QADANQPDKSWFRLNYDGTAVAGWHGQPCFWAARENGSVWLLLAANRKTHFARFDARNASLLIDDGGKIVVCPLAPMDGNRRKEQVAGLQAAGPPRFALRHVLCATAWNWPNADPGQLDKCWFRLNRDGSAMAGWHPHPCFWAAKDDGTVLAILAGSREMSTLRFDPQQSALKAGNLVCTRILGPEVPESEHNALSKKLVATKCWTIGYGGGSRYENVTFFEDGRWHTFTTHAAGGWLAGRWQVAGDSVMVRHMPDYGFIERIEERGGNIQAVHRSSARIINEGVVLPQHDPSHRAEDHAKN
ncbi:MAG TPA: hypothetical protein VMP01_26470, partial [Pirellulaceae bacterium]|nr:hypothetical protein [Pirellulaceae bacterium]